MSKSLPFLSAALAFAVLSVPSLKEPAFRP